MALTEAEELELLELERARAMAPAKQPPVSQGIDPLANPMAALGEATQAGFNAAGEKTAETLATGIGLERTMLPPPFNVLPRVDPTGAKLPPVAAAAVGTGVQMIPDIAASFVAPAPAKAIANEMPGVGLAKRAVQAIKGPNLEEAKTAAAQLKQSFRPQAAEKARAVGQQAVRQAEDSIVAAKKELQDLMAGLKDDVTGKAKQLASERIQPIRTLITDLKNRLNSLPAQTRTKLVELNRLEMQAKRAIGAAEEAGGFAFKSSPKFEKDITNPQYVSRVTNKLRPTFQKGPEAIAASMKPQNIQRVRKLYQESEALSDLGHAETQQFREAAAQALELKSPEFAAARQQFIEVKNAIKATPIEAKGRAESLRRNINNARELLQKEATEAQQMVEAVKASSAKEASAKMVEKRKQIIDLSKALMKNKQFADDLYTAARRADKEELLRIQAEASKIIDQGLKNSMMLRKLKAAGYTAATAVGLGGVGKLLLGNQ